MTTSALEYIFDQLGYSAITSEFIELPEIAQIHITSNGSIFREPNGVAKYYLDTSKGLLYQTKFDKNGNELGICAIISVGEIVSVATRNAYSAAMFVGHNY